MKDFAIKGTITVVFAAAAAYFQLAGLPMRIAVAMVSGNSTGSPFTMGAAPAAWKPSILGRRVDTPLS